MPKEMQSWKVIVASPSGKRMKYSNFSRAAISEGRILSRTSLVKEIECSLLKKPKSAFALEVQLFKKGRNRQKETIVDEDAKKRGIMSL